MNIKSIKAYPAGAPKTKDSQKVALFLGIILAIMAICQLATISHFIEIIYNFNFLPSYSDASAFAATLLIFEILALPFLFRLKISHGLRATSMIMGWLAMLAWVFLAFWMWLAPVVTTNESGLLGGIALLTSGPWTVSLVGILAVSMAWATWGLWPLKELKFLKTRESNSKSKSINNSKSSNKSKKAKAKVTGSTSTEV